MAEKLVGSRCVQIVGKRKQNPLFNLACICTKMAFRSLQIWNFYGEDTPRPPYKVPASGTRDNFSQLDFEVIRHLRVIFP